MDFGNTEDLSKSFFLAQISHDLRQPMQALSIYVCSLLGEELTPEQYHIAKNIESSTNNLKNMLNNLLDISQIDARGLQYTPQILDSQELLKRIAKEYKTIAKCQHINFYSGFHRGLIYSDSICIERIIRNLLSNALKYNGGKIIFGSRREQNYIRIFVIDNGCGISADEIDKIFTEFYQSKQIKDNRNTGTGLGLAICKKLAQIIGTTIEVKSIEGRGTCFSFRLPIYQT